VARVWKAQESGTTGTLKLRFDLSQVPGAGGVVGNNNLSNIRLLVDANGVFASGATSVSPTTFNNTTHIADFDFDFTGATGYFKIYATRYAEELAEWLRIQKEQDWAAFYTKAGGGGASVVYCVNGSIDLNSTLDAALTLVNASNCNYDGITSASGTTRPKIFRRTVTFTTSSNQLPVQAAILVEWQEGPNQIFSVPINTTYTY
jgi:hypothetical protein